MQRFKAATIIFTLFLMASCTIQSPHQIKSSIDERLLEISGLGRHDFEINVRGSTVTLLGYVSSLADSRRVEDAARSVKGVKQVINKLRIVGNSVVVEDSLAKRIRDVVKANPNLTDYKVEVVQQGSQTILLGKVASYDDKYRIEKIAYDLAPERAIISKLKVAEKTNVSDQAITRKLQQVLESEGVSGLDNVSFESKEGVVHFKGVVKDHREIDRMLSIALMVDGVKSVRSDVSVDSGMLKAR